MPTALGRRNLLGCEEIKNNCSIRGATKVRFTAQPLLSRLLSLADLSLSCVPFSPRQHPLPRPHSVSRLCDSSSSPAPKDQPRLPLTSSCVRFTAQPLLSRLLSMQTSASAAFPFRPGYTLCPRPRSNCVTVHLPSETTTSPHQGVLAAPLVHHVALLCHHREESK